MPEPKDSTNMQFADICETSLFDIWQRTTEYLDDYEAFLLENDEQETTISSFPQGMVVQYIPNGIIIMFGPQENLGEEYGY